MVNLRKFQLSCRLFWGFNTILDLDYIDSTEQIIDTICIRLENHLKNANLIFLIEELEKIKFSSPTLETILLEYQPTDIVYVCDHNHECCGAEKDTSENCMHNY